MPGTNEHDRTTAYDSIADVVEDHGPWTAMSIHLGDGVYTRMPPSPDGRMPRLVQTVADLVGKPLNQCRILDLACLEGHYALEFGLHGAEVLGIEIREQNLAKAEFARRALRLDNVRFVQDDVRNLGKANHGRFDVVLCYGILYHLDAPDVFQFVHDIRSACERLAIFETFLSTKDQTTLRFGDKTYSGRYYGEHAPDADAATKATDLFASIDNVRSFWLTRASLLNLLADAGFTTVFDTLTPRYPAQMADRPTLAAVCGTAVPVLSSPITASYDLGLHAEQAPSEIHPTNMEFGWLHRTAKRVLPQPVKNLIKPTLRAVGLLHADPTPRGISEHREHLARKASARLEQRTDDSSR